MIYMSPPSVIESTGLFIQKLDRLSSSPPDRESDFIAMMDSVALPFLADVMQMDPEFITVSHT